MKRGMMAWALVAACWLTAGSARLNADIYTWTDENGVQHYSNRPPSDAENPKVLFKEYRYDPQADQQRFEMQQQEWKTLLEDLEAEERQAAVEEQRRREQARQNSRPTLSERTAAEKKRLEEKIAELEKKPLEYFGSFKNKRVRIGFYRYRLEALMQDPEKYFENPVSFEGNIKETD